MTAIRWALRLILGLVALCAVLLVLDITTYDRQAVLNDYSRLKQGIAQNHSNLDWLIEHRKFDPSAHDAATQARLDSSLGRVQAYFAIRDFVGGFGDPHLFIARGTAPAGVQRVGTVSLLEGTGRASDGPDCASAGYETDDRTTSLIYPDMARWEPTESTFFPSGVIEGTGFVRIAAFGEDQYLDACQIAWKPGLDSRDLQLATREVLQSELRSILQEFTKSGVETVLVDVTGNGGGSEWASEAAALFASGELVRSAVRMPDPQCDRMPIWRGVTVCPIFAAFETGDAGVETLEGEGVWDGALAILVDRNSASATEAFAVWLHGSNRARLVGERTLGAGCGFIGGGSTVEFASLPLHVMIPNCSRFTRDGTNEIEGLAPDVHMQWSNTAKQEMQTLLDRL